MTAFNVAGTVILFSPIIFIYQVVAESNKHNHTFSLVLPNVTCAIAPNNKQSYTVWFLDARPSFSSGLFRQPAEFHEQFEICICPSLFLRMLFLQTLSSLWQSHAVEAKSAPAAARAWGKVWVRYKNHLSTTFYGKIQAKTKPIWHWLRMGLPEAVKGKGKLFKETSPKIEFNPSDWTYRVSQKPGSQGHRAFQRKNQDASWPAGPVTDFSQCLLGSYHHLLIFLVYLILTR